MEIKKYRPMLVSSVTYNLIPITCCHCNKNSAEAEFLLTDLEFLCNSFVAGRVGALQAL